MFKLDLEKAEEPEIKLPTSDGSFTMEVTNRFKGLDLIDRVPEEVWMEVRDTVQEAGIKTILKEKKCKKAISIHKYL